MLCLVLMRVHSAISNDLPFLLLTVTGGCLFSTVLISSADLVNGTVSSKLEAIYPAVMYFSGCVLLTLLVKRAQVVCVFHPADLLVYLLGILFFVTYDGNNNLSPERLALLGQMLVFWFALRLSLSIFSNLGQIFTVVLIVTAAIEAIWGMAQIYGISKSNHSLFRLTGSFHNPGPFSGYLAVMLPLTLDAVFSVQMGTLKRVKKEVAFYGLLAAGCLMVIVLPAGMSRSAWLAAGAGCTWLAWRRLAPLQRFGGLLVRFRRWTIVGLAMLLLMAGAAFPALYQLKKESADGRLLMWKITWQAIKEHPLTGVGLGGFPGAYATAQFAYFSSGNYVEGEEYVAGNPEYAFNEPMQLWLEGGLSGLIVFAALLAYCFYVGVRNRRYGSCAALLAFGVLSLSSYPFQMPSFVVLLVFLLTDCLRKPFTPFSVRLAYAPRMLVVMCLLMVASSWWVWSSQQARFEAYRQWTGIKMLYQAGAWKAAAEKYRLLEPELRHLPDFLFEYAQCLTKSGHFEESDALLKRASELSSDPMIRNVRGRNHQALGDFRKAESFYLEAMFLQPARVYPYYLLAKLYAEKDFLQPEKMKDVARRALTMRPKVDNMAVKEMREELKKLLKNENLL